MKQRVSLGWHDDFNRDNPRNGCFPTPSMALMLCSILFTVEDRLLIGDMSIQMKSVLEFRVTTSPNTNIRRSSTAACIQSALDGEYHVNQIFCGDGDQEMRT